MLTQTVHKKTNYFIKFTKTPFRLGTNIGSIFIQYQK